MEKAERREQKTTAGRSGEKEEEKAASPIVQTKIRWKEKGAEKGQTRGGRTGSKREGDP